MSHVIRKPVNLFYNIEVSGHIHLHFSPWVSASVDMETLVAPIIMNRYTQADLPVYIHGSKNPEDGSSGNEAIKNSVPVSF